MVSTFGLQFRFRIFYLINYPKKDNRICTLIVLRVKPNPCEKQPCETYMYLHVCFPLLSDPNGASCAATTLGLHASMRQKKSIYETYRSRVVTRPQCLELGHPDAADSWPFGILYILVSKMEVLISNKYYTCSQIAVNVIRLPMGLRVRTRRVATDGRIAYRHID